MKPDQHKKKRSAQYKRKHGKTEKKETANTPKANSSGPQRASTCVPVSQTPAAGSQTQRAASVNLPTKSNGFAESETEGVRQFSRRKIESNWDRYEPLDEDKDDISHDGLKGADFKTLLSQTGDVSSQFRFKDEQLWEDDDQSDADQQQGLASFPAIDCHHLARMLKAIPLPSRLNIDRSFFEASVLKSMEETASKHKERLDSTPAERFLMPENIEGSTLLLSTSTRGSDDRADCCSIEDEKGSEDQESEKSVSRNVQDTLQHLSDVTDPLEGIDASPTVEEKEEQLMEAINQEAGNSSTLDSENSARHQAQSENRRGQQASSNLDAPNEEAGNSEEGDESIRSASEPRHLEEAGHISEAYRTQINVVPATEKEHKIQQEQKNARPDLKTELPSGSHPVTDAKHEAPVAAHPSLPPKTTIHTPPTSAEMDDDELDFLLSLEKPVQTRNRVVSGDIPQAGEAKEVPEVDTERRPPGSQQGGSGAASKTTPNPAKSTVSTQNASSSLEDWLDSVLDD